jgi:hypothetical protein
VVLFLNTPSEEETVATDEELREAAVHQLKRQREFGRHVVSYVVVNAMLILIWYVTGHGYFWPAWVLGGWGIGLALNAWDVYGRRPISEDEIRREMDRQRGL